MNDYPTLWTDPPKPKRDFTEGIRAREREKAKPQPAPTAKETITAIVLAELGMGAGSDIEIGERLVCKGLVRAGKVESVRKRRRDLEQNGYVRYSGERNSDGDQVWEITYSGQLRAGIVEAAA